MQRMKEVQSLGTGSRSPFTFPSQTFEVGGGDVLRVVGGGDVLWMPEVEEVRVPEVKVWGVVLRGVVLRGVVVL